MNPTELQAYIAALEAQNSELNAQNTELKAKNAEHIGTMDMWEKRVIELESEKEKLRIDNMLTPRVAELEAELAQVRKAANALRIAVTITIPKLKDSIEWLETTTEDD